MNPAKNEEQYCYQEDLHAQQRYIKDYMYISSMQLKYLLISYSLGDIHKLTGFSAYCTNIWFKLDTILYFLSLRCC